MSELQPLVSIILPVYNGERTLKRALESLLSQTFTNFELFVGIDGTKDNSKAISLSFNDDRIKIIEHPNNLGLANNLNALIELVHPNAAYIAMAEQDDVYVPERLQWQVEVLESHSEIGLVSGIAEFKSDTKTLQFPGILVHGQQFPQGEALFRYLYINQLKVVNTCMLFRKATHLNNILRFNNTYGNFNVDWDYVLRFALVSGIYGIPKVLVSMDRTTKNTSVTKDKWAQFKASRQLIKNIKNEFPNIIQKTDYHAALKMCRKIELGYYTKSKIIAFGFLYSCFYLDFYFIKYIIKRIKRKIKQM
ncbi:glycosyltransferase family 2 protein [Aestuariivivens sediminis]|uniref:glycosyltransferase family 2 protein n=1 Tax=Aestuariivivens sediminis TaxID=2913557 RepID=UPI001F5925F6|nr:glycosyltransferase family 2 protein [Aestuariivivens sediminis]